MSVFRFFHRLRGATVISYALLLGLISAGAVVTVDMAGQSLGGLLSSAGEALSRGGEADAQDGNGISVPDCAPGQVITGDGRQLRCVALGDFLSRSAGAGPANAMQATLDMGQNPIVAVGTVTTVATPTEPEHLATVRLVQDTLTGGTAGLATQSFVTEQIAAIGDPDWAAIQNRPAHTTALPPACAATGEALGWDADAQMWRCGTGLATHAELTAAIGAIADPAWSEITGRPAHTTATPGSCTGAGQALRWNGSSWSCGTVTASLSGALSCQVRSNLSDVPYTTVSCQGSEIRTGGGCKANASSIHLYESYPTGNSGWECRSATSRITAYAICCTLN